MVSWVITILLPVAAWIFTSYIHSFFHPGLGTSFTAAAVLSAAIGGIRMALAAVVLNAAAMNIFATLYLPAAQPRDLKLWTLLLVVVALLVGYAREKWSAAEMLAGRLSTDLARLRDELESQRTDLRRFHDLSVRLSSSLELQRLLNDVLTSVATLQKTDLALLLVLPERTSKALRVETYAGFTPEQIKVFGEFPASFFSLEERVSIEDLLAPGTYFPFMDAAKEINFRAVFSMPIMNARSEPLGVVVTFFRQPHSPSDRQSRLVELYARQAANALDNARLYRDSLDTLAAEQHRTAVLRSLAEASVQINAALTLDSVLQAITDQARSIIGARQSFTTLLAKGAWSRSLTCVSVAEGEPAFSFPLESSENFILACNLNKPVRLDSSGAGTRPWRAMMKNEQSTRQGWMAAPLVTRDGRNLGLIQLFGKLNGEFTEDDEAILVQLAHMASVATDNVRLYREAQEQIAEIKRTQEALERSKENMELAQQYVGIGIWEWDLHTETLAWTDKISRLHGVEPGKFDGQYESWMECIHPEDRQQVHGLITDALSRNGEYEVQYRVVFADKTVQWLETRGRTMMIGTTPVRMLGVAMDITSRKLAEEALRRSEKLAATGRLAASIAHEINNPLAAVTNALYILRVSPGMPQSSLEYVRTAEAELARVVHITKQTLGFYREPSTPVPIYVPQLVQEVLSAYGSRIEKNKIAAETAYRDVGQLTAFPGELRQVFSNLVLNALEALPESGRLSIRVRESRDSQRRLGIRITVADNGPGIPQENLSKIFEPFFSTKEAKGTGLGLWVSTGIIQKHRGTIRVRSTRDGGNHGTCFCMFLPFPQEEAAPLNQPLPQEEVILSDHAPEEKPATGDDRSAA